MTRGARGRGIRASRTLAIVGSGVVGTASGQGFQAKGYDVVFADVALDRVALLRHQGLRAIDVASLAEVLPDAYLMTVPSPTTAIGVDLSAVEAASVAVGHALARHPGWPIVVVRSTVPPGTTDELVIPTLAEASGKEPGRDFGVCMNPEFLRAASAPHDFLAPRVIVIGSLDERSDRALRDIYSPWRDVRIVSTTLRTAEATKYVSNLFNATKISFFNEMHRVLLALDADPEVAFAAVTQAAEGLWNAHYGTRGGSPYGGVCLPKDTVGFLRFAEGMGLSELLPMLRATVRINEQMAVWAEEPATVAHGAQSATA